MKVLEVITLLNLILPMITTLVGMAERLFTKPGSGAEKKEAVTQGAQLFADTMVKVSTGGQKETWQTIRDNVQVVDYAIEAAVAALNLGQKLTNRDYRSDAQVN